MMIKNRLFLLFMGMIFLGSCVKEGELNYTERRVVGTWYYETVRYSDGWGSDFITNEYHSLFLTFNNDFSFVYNDDLTGDSGSGVWDLVESYNGDYSTSQLFISYTDDDSGELYQIVFENISVSKRKMTAQFKDHKSCYYYDLVKL